MSVSGKMIVDAWSHDVTPEGQSRWTRKSAPQWSIVETARGSYEARCADVVVAMRASLWDAMDVADAGGRDV